MLPVHAVNEFGDVAQPLDMFSFSFQVCWCMNPNLAFDPLRFEVIVAEACLVNGAVESFSGDICC